MMNPTISIDIASDRERLMARELTLGVQEVVDENVMTGRGLEGSLLEQLLVLLGADAHVLLTKTVGLLSEVMGFLR